MSNTLACVIIIWLREAAVQQQIDSVALGLCFITYVTTEIRLHRRVIRGVGNDYLHTHIRVYKPVPVIAMHIG